MTEQIEKKNLIEKIGKYETIEILINERQEMLFEGIIDPIYIAMHFDRIVKMSHDFDLVKMIGYFSNKSKELIIEVFVSK